MTGQQDKLNHAFVRVASSGLLDDVMSMCRALRIGEGLVVDAIEILGDSVAFTFAPECWGEFVGYDSLCEEGVRFVREFDHGPVTYEFYCFVPNEHEVMNSDEWLAFIGCQPANK